MTHIEIIFLGTTASIPTKYRNHAAIYLKYQSENEYSFLFDCGEGTQRQIFSSGMNFMRLDNIFITHWHADHFAGLLGLLETMSLEKRTKPLYVYGPEASKFIEVLSELGYSSKGFKLIPKDVPFDGREETILTETDEYQIISVPVSHGVPAVAYAFVEKDRIKIDKKKAAKYGMPKKGRPYKTLKEKGFVIYKGREIKLEDVSFVEKGKKVVYSGDTKPVKNLIELAKDADVLIHDSTYFEQEFDERKHSTAEDAIDVFIKAGAKQLILTHISRRYQSEKELYELLKTIVKKKNLDMKKIKIARDFMHLKI
ncbi:MAG: ribonuclease Z [Candidatus Aenigmatarchaeota archaeon]|nr:MAG: ribonuclease Z [Candidatus Aenigmarchaeota archaeon]